MNLTLNLSPDLIHLLKLFLTPSVNSASADPQPFPSIKTVYCEYICIEKVLEQGIYSPEEFEQKMANAVKGTAPELASFLKRYKEQGLLNFKEHTKKQIFDHLRQHFPEMREYDYPNFAAAF